MEVQIRPAQPDESRCIQEILLEAARWLESKGMVMWRDNELQEAAIASDTAAGLFHVAVAKEEIVGVVKFQLEDPLFWPDVPEGESAFVHRLAVKRAYAGRGVSTALLSWAVMRARSLKREFLRLDCEAHRHRLRQVYEAFGFTLHSNRQVGPYFVSRYEMRLNQKRSGETLGRE
jgi:GNAT superfamily N-acetyltransferase